MESILQSHFEELESKANQLRTLGHPIRLAIIDLLEKNGALTVTDIYTSLDIEQAVASHHLRIMKAAQLVHGQKSGKNIYYDLEEGISYSKLQ